MNLYFVYGDKIVTPDPHRLAAAPASPVTRC